MNLPFKKLTARPAFLISGVSAFLLASCIMPTPAGPGRHGRPGLPNENHMASLPDFTEEGYNLRVNNKNNSGGNPSFTKTVVLSYHVGDRFRLKKAMFLEFSPEAIVELAEPDSPYTPGLAAYQRNPEAYRFGENNYYQVMKLVPAGTVIQIVKVAEVDFSPRPFFVFPGENDWFRSADFRDNRNLEYSKVRIVLEKNYNREFFQKL